MIKRFPFGFIMHMHIVLLVAVRVICGILLSIFIKSYHRRGGLSTPLRNFLHTELIG